MPSNSTSPPHFLQLWFSRVADSTMNVEQTIQSLLSDSEIKRLNRIKNKNKHREYLLSRALMRHALSQHFQLPKSEWHFIEQSGSPPIIKNLPENIYVSLSHSNSLICFAIACCPVGIDLEAGNRRRDFTALAEMFMTGEEMERLARDESERAGYFYRVWCAKEAYYKALSSSDQSNTPLVKIRFSDLVESKDNWHLIEGKIKLCLFAVMIKNKPGQISCHHYLTSNEYPGDLELFERDSNFFFNPSVQ